MSDLLRRPEFEVNHEFDLEVIDFESYRQLCDMVDGFRKVGIQEEGAYQSALEDENTKFIEYGEARIPFLTPLRYEKMYDAERCCAMSGKENPMLLSIPLELLEQMQLETFFEIDEDTIVIIEEFVEVDDSVKLDKHDLSRLPFVNVKSYDFKNPNLPHKPANETAWMAAYGFDMTPNVDRLRPYEGERLVDEIMEIWQNQRAMDAEAELPDDNSTDTFLLSAEQLAQRSDIIEQLWEISQIGFGEILGEYHPVAMEFNRQFFDKQIMSDNKVTAIHCVDGEVVCFGFVGLDMKDNDWLNEQSSVMQEEARKANAEQRASVHFHELIGRGRRGMGYATKILSTLFDTMSQTQYPYSVFFESTNTSSMYIPPLILRDIQRTQSMNLSSDIHTIGKLSYWALTAESDERNAA